MDTANSPNFLQQCVSHQDHFGVMLSRDKIIDGNALLYTGIKLILAEQLMVPWNSESKITCRLTYEYALRETEDTWHGGLLSRYGKRGDRQAFDDYVGMLAASAVYDGGAFARRVLKHGRDNSYCWNNVNPFKWDFSGFFVRMPGFWALAKAAGGEWQNPFDQFMAFVDLAILLFKENGSSGTSMDILKVKTYERRCSWLSHPLTRLGCVIFRAAYFRRHPKGTKETYIDYFGPEYPFSKIPDFTF